ncbi:GNAT family N-acetyltransferase [bacterium (Candidatus Blackallbacteria) CG17_big_fil_post_rev_8_21_14_2_50_48_46]|uniref:GNAT family N-acetyltransferase n=1 Tax=bacterium (Candidatus Blackallbacteria) CG17_big_fil_post_rev_8_21_14_2_50_48_46 TaxID=2014261 RepID=A0A2M7G228_9BACT|nr:MAG: GNAT family N-acetyltransferase [bacterium (Candidatus Blackallbacteria) CG18_big_fil_WC_8_21_14_2_50_49_26]PIW15720.1 MAG: GNAT family N-acetyltransferase [bacterium (Candidatus Blackallbacteria) CG17_big_fil_post_rev_8_21_14_2_50_48_46]PIW49222.1 MAG: GNAT family N-acetyltransferase [bacterium (Candidatus Blackallbacteria) CG13_big_fil_rev_8_21_14_2_50_49_14]
MSEPPRFIFRILKPEDSRAYRAVRLESLKTFPECFGADYQAQSQLPKLFFEQEIETGSRENIMLGAFADSRLIGLCGLIRPQSDRAEIIQMYLNPRYQGLGLGAKLLAEATEIAQTHLQAKTLSLAVFTHNQQALRTYLKAGFEIVSTQPERNEYLMQKKIG